MRASLPKSSKLMDLDCATLRPKRSVSSDFVEETFDGEVFAIEVKSGKSFKAHAALDNALATKGYGIDRALVLCGM